MTMKTTLASLRSAWLFRRQMSTRMDEVLVVDVEATTGADRPVGALRDIIEIGVCRLSLVDDSVLDAARMLVRPTCSEVTEYCSSITGITPEQVRQGHSFSDACQWLREQFDSEGVPWASFGEFDLQQFKGQCEREGVQFPFGRAHINIKVLAALRFRWGRQKGLLRACSALNIEPTGRHHSAVNDAANAALVLSACLKNS